MDHDVDSTPRTAATFVTGSQAMSSSDFKFQRLPSSSEVHSLSPTTYDSTYADRIHSTSGNHARLTTVPEFHYDPIQDVGPEWPIHPDRWSTSLFFRCVSFTSHMVLTLSPIIFLMLAFAAISVDGQPVSRKGQIVIEAAKVGPSLFPIIFAAIIGRLMRTYALWRAERGSSIGLLEQFNGSQNLLAAVERAFHLQGLRGIGLLIIVLWCLSPLGGQSSLRVLSMSQAGAGFQHRLTYFDTSNYTNTALLGASSLSWGFPSLSAIYQACLLAPDTVISSSVDLWGNVKIPRMQGLPLYNGAPDQDWIDVPNDRVAYSSLSGIMISGLNRNATANFTIESTYLNFTCSDPRRFNMDASGDGDMIYFREVRQWTGNLTYHHNESESLFGDPNSTGPLGSTRQWSSFAIDTNWNYTDPALVNQTEINLIYLTKDGDAGIITGYKCSVGYTHVESWVTCSGLECLVAKMRPSRSLHPPSNITPFNQGVPNYYAILVREFPWATGEQHSSVTSPTDWYISGSETPYNPSFGSAVYTNVTGAQLSHRLGALINTFWQTSITLTTLARPQLTENGTTNSSNLGYPTLETSASMRVQTDVYIASKIWIVLTVIISFIMLFCGIAGAVFKYLSTVPDILGYVSSLTKDNPYFQGPLDVNDDHLDGMARTRLLQDVVVQIGNVKPWDAKGYIALRSIANGEDKRATRVKNITPRFRSPISS